MVTRLAAFAALLVAGCNTFTDLGPAPSDGASPRDSGHDVSTGPSDMKPGDGGVNARDGSTDAELHPDVRARDAGTPIEHPEMRIRVASRAYQDQRDVATVWVDPVIHSAVFKMWTLPDSLDGMVELPPVGDEFPEIGGDVTSADVQGTDIAYAYAATRNTNETETVLRFAGGLVSPKECCETREAYAFAAAITGGNYDPYTDDTDANRPELEYAWLERFLVESDVVTALTTTRDATPDDQMWTPFCPEEDCVFPDGDTADAFGTGGRLVVVRDANGDAFAWDAVQQGVRTEDAPVQGVHSLDVPFDALSLVYLEPGVAADEETYSYALLDGTTLNHRIIVYDGDGDGEIDLSGSADQTTSIDGTPIAVGGAVGPQFYAHVVLTEGASGLAIQTLGETVGSGPFESTHVFTSISPLEVLGFDVTAAPTTSPARMLIVALLVEDGGTVKERVFALPAEDN
jgi:hypothetical protein